MFGKCNDMNTYPENERYHPTHFKQFLVAYEVMGQDLLATLYSLEGRLSSATPS